MWCDLILMNTEILNSCEMYGADDWLRWSHIVMCGNFTAPASVLPRAGQETVEDPRRSEQSRDKYVCPQLFLSPVSAVLRSDELASIRRSLVEQPIPASADRSQHTSWHCQEAQKDERYRRKVRHGVIAGGNRQRRRSNGLVQLAICDVKWDNNYSHCNKMKDNWRSRLIMCCRYRHNGELSQLTRNDE